MPSRLSLLIAAMRPDALSVHAAKGTEYLASGGRWH
jgi:hypothetical protein